MGEFEYVDVGVCVLKCRNQATHMENGFSHGQNAVSLKNGNPPGANRQWNLPSRFTYRILPLHCAVSEINAPGLDRDLEAPHLEITIFF